MKLQICNWSTILSTCLLLSCQNTATTSSATATDTTTDTIAESADVSTQSVPVGQPLQLPALKEGEDIEFENENVRILIGEPIEDVIVPIYVQPKNTSYKQFELEAVALAFEKVIGKALVLSENTMRRTLCVYDLTTGKRLLEVESFVDFLEIVPENDHQFYCYQYNENLPRVVWYADKAEWVNVNVPPELLNADLEDTKRNFQQQLRKGLVLTAYQKVKIDILKRKVTPLNQYKWARN